MVNVWLETRLIKRKPLSEKKNLMNNHFLHVFSSIWEIPLFLLSQMPKTKFSNVQQYHNASGQISVRPESRLAGVTLGPGNWYQIHAGNTQGVLGLLLVTCPCFEYSFLKNINFQVVPSVQTAQVQIWMKTIPTCIMISNSHN